MHTVKIIHAILSVDTKPEHGNIFSEKSVLALRPNHFPFPMGTGCSENKEAGASS